MLKEAIGNSEVDLVILDSFNTLFRTGSEHECGFAAKKFVLDLKRRGLAVVITCQSGKSGKPRGASRLQHVMNTVIALKYPLDYSVSQGARFEVHFERAHGLHENDVFPFEARLKVCDGAARWATGNLKAI